MDANTTSAETYVDRHHRLCRALRDGEIDDPEVELFIRLLDDLPPALVVTPFLYDVSWGGRRFDLLFTDGLGTWCAVEVKNAPLIVGSGPQRKNCKTRWKRRYAKLVDQAAIAALIGRRRFNDTLYAVGLWNEGGRWRVVARVNGGPQDCC